MAKRAILERLGVTSLFPVFSRLSGAVRDDTDGEAVQPHAVSHRSEPTLVKMNGTANLLIGDEIPTG